MRYWNIWWAIVSPMVSTDLRWKRGDTSTSEGSWNEIQLPFHFTRDPTRLEWIARAFFFHTDRHHVRCSPSWYYFISLLSASLRVHGIVSCVWRYRLLHKKYIVELTIIDDWWCFYPYQLSNRITLYFQALISHKFCLYPPSIHRVHYTVFKSRSDLNLGATDFKQGLTILL